MKVLFQLKMKQELEKLKLSNRIRATHEYS